jgi:hypothetical protein
MSHTKIYVLVETGRETSGHGETAPYVRLAVKETYTTDVHPAFRSRKNAEEYCAKWKKEHYIAPEIFEIDLI